MKSDLSNQNPILHRTFNKILCLGFRKASHLFLFYKLLLLSDEMLNETKSYLSELLNITFFTSRDKFLKEHNITQSSSLLRKTRGYLVKLVFLCED